MNSFTSELVLFVPSDSRARNSDLSCLLVWKQERERIITKIYIRTYCKTVKLCKCCAEWFPQLWETTQWTF